MKLLDLLRAVFMHTGREIAKMSAFASKTSMEGPLSKWTNVMKGWQYRWFVLDYQTGLLSYYVSKEKMMRGSRRGCVRLRGALIGIDDQDDSTFTITCDQKTFHFQAQHTDERVQWVTALEETILKHSKPARFGPKSRPRPKPTVQDFDRKLAESDAYLQILIDQVSSFEARIERIEDEAEKQKYEQLRAQAKAMIESVKQAIVLLQLAKNTVNPVNGLVANEIDVPHHDNAVDEPLDNQVPLETQVITAEVEPAHPSPTSVEIAAECFEENNAPVSPTSPRPTPVITPRTEHIPALSYSSSDDEDFYDADEFLDLDLGPPQGRPPIEDEEEEEAVPGQELRPHMHPSSMYEEDSEEEILDCEGHGSVISHLLSQVRLGMDLTKVVLPTFILERRSLLEMYADFLAHPEIFANISDFESPKDRIVQVVKWFMTAFHAGRNSSVAKKPYNPILGETMRCWWDLGTDNSKIDVNEEQVTEGPVPWATKDQVTFIAEQVSHHPPVSAFYAEHYNKQMSINAHIWTKSKFLGLSIGVENVGQACVSDLKHDEEYIMTFPNGYGRSILTIPWFEMGGKCIISCAKTGFTGTVTFLTKPFYGGKRNRVSAEITHVSDRKPFMTITGEWNGVLTAKYANGQTEVFADTTTMKVNKKRIMPTEKQGDYESKKLWKDVTHYLKTKNIDKATESKHFLEQRQRQEAKERKETGEKWQTKYFHEDGDCWIFDNPLEKRMKAAQEEAARKQEQSVIQSTTQSAPQSVTQPAPQSIPQSANPAVTNSHIPGLQGDGPTANNPTPTKTADQELNNLLS